MRLVFHPEFATDVKRFRDQYAQISQSLATRFRREIYAAVEIIELSPTRFQRAPLSTIVGLSFRTRLGQIEVKGTSCPRSFSLFAATSKLLQVFIYEHSEH